MTQIGAQVGSWYCSQHLKIYSVVALVHTFPVLKEICCIYANLRSTQETSILNILWFNNLCIYLVCSQEKQS